jgi:hypothetical protein
MLILRKLIALEIQVLYFWWSNQHLPHTHTHALTRAHTHTHTTISCVCNLLLGDKKESVCLSWKVLSCISPSYWKSLTYFYLTHLLKANFFFLLSVTCCSMSLVLRTVLRVLIFFNISLPSVTWACMLKLWHRYSYGARITQISYHL